MLKNILREISRYFHKKDHAMSTLFHIDGAGAVIRMLREDANLTIEELTISIREKTGKPIRKSTLSRYENNKRGLTIEALASIAKGLDKRPELLALLCLAYLYPTLRHPTSKKGQYFRLLLQSFRKTR